MRIWLWRIRYLKWTTCIGFFFGEKVWSYVFLAAGQVPFLRPLQAHFHLSSFPAPHEDREVPGTITARFIVIIIIMSLNIISLVIITIVNIIISPSSPRRLLQSSSTPSKSSHLPSSYHPRHLLIASFLTSLVQSICFDLFLSLFSCWLCIWQVVNSIVSHGCFLNECTVEHSIIGVRSRLESGAELVVSV